MCALGEINISYFHFKGWLYSILLPWYLHDQFLQMPAHVSFVKQKRTKQKILTEIMINSVFRLIEFNFQSKIKNYLYNLMAVITVLGIGKGMCVCIYI